jgi:hypothetical protein
MTINKTISIKNLFVPALILATALIMPVSLLQAEELGSLELTAKNMTATAYFVLGTPCTPYTLEWGDGTKDIQESDEDMMCIQVLDEVSLNHQYEEAGTYEVTLIMNKETFTNKITVPVGVTEFGLDDVASITAKWVDPNELMADEEYYVYTITLESGEVMVLEVAGFTTIEWRNEQFVEAGYTGEVDALLAMVEETESETTPETEEPATDGLTSIYKELVSVLETLVEKLGQLLNLQKAI